MRSALSSQDANPYFALAGESLFMTSEPAARGRETPGLSTGVLGTVDVVFMVMAAAAPMAVVVALMPLAFAFGNGAGIPGTYAGAIAAMVLFAIGYVRIIPYVRNAGAFYAYIAASAGKTAGLAAAYVAAFCYFALSTSTLTTLAFFSEQFFVHITGHHARWDYLAYIAIAIIAYLAYHRITLAATVLGIALAAEVVIILLLDGAILYHGGLRSFAVTDFAPATILTPGLGIGAIYAFDSMIGVEGTAIYQEEARNTRVTIPRATYISIVLVGLFYILTAWCLSSSVGSTHVASVAKADPGTFIINRASEHLGRWGAEAISVLVLTSSLAAALALFNNAARYLYALARDGVLPARLATTHPRHRSPHVASGILVVAMAAVVAISAMAGLDPLVNVSTALVGLGSVGLMTLLAATSLAIPAFFARRGNFGPGTTFAPLIGGLVIAVAVVLAFANYPMLTGVDSAVINHLPYLLIVLAICGACQAQWIKRHRPRVFARIATTRVEDRAD